MSIYVNTSELFMLRISASPEDYLARCIERAESVTMVKASGKELDYILARYPHLPRVDPMPDEIKWYGETAKFIVGNMTIEGIHLSEFKQEI